MNVSVDPIFLTTTLIKRVLANNEIGIATGFFFSKEDKVWLITNKHVIYGDTHTQDNAQPEVDEFKLVLHINKSDFTKNEEVPITLSIKNKPIWLEHKDKNIDIVCLPINLDRSKYHFVTIADDLINVENIKIGFEKLFVMGYPHGWYDSKHNLPITRIGHLSSPFGVPFQGFPFMLGDVETHPGMSGSPVFMYLKDYITTDDKGGLTTNLGAFKYVLLGVYSGQPLWPVTDRITNKTVTIPHSLSVIWFASLIKDILDQ